MTQNQLLLQHGTQFTTAERVNVNSRIAKDQTFVFECHGGIVYGPTYGLLGEYAGAVPDSEIIAPLDKLKKMIQDSLPEVDEDKKEDDNDLKDDEDETEVSE